MEMSDLSFHVGFAITRCSIVDEQPILSVLISMGYVEILPSILKVNKHTNQKNNFIKNISVLTIQ